MQLLTNPTCCHNQRSHDDDDDDGNDDGDSDGDSECDGDDDGDDDNTPTPSLIMIITTKARISAGWK